MSSDQLFLVRELCDVCFSHPWQHLVLSGVRFFVSVEGVLFLILV